jgi:WD40 repeat protein
MFYRLLCCLMLACFFLPHYELRGQPAINKSILWTAEWSPDGKRIAIGGNTDTLKIYSKNKLKELQAIPFKNTITRVAWHPSNNIIAVATQMSEQVCAIIDLNTHKQTPLTGISPEGARGIAWNHSGEFLAVADNSGQILIYSEEGLLIKSIQNENTKSITAIAWHPNKNIFVTTSDKIRMFDLEGNLLQSIQHRNEDVLLLSVVWHTSGAFFVTGDYGYDTIPSLLQFWDENGELLTSNSISRGEYRNLAWNKKGTKLATASDALRIWDAEGNLLSTGDSTDYLWGVSWNKTGRKIITSSLEQHIIVWNNKARKIMVVQ